MVSTNDGLSSAGIYCHTYYMVDDTKPKKPATKADPKQMNLPANNSSG